MKQNKCNNHFPWDMAICCMVEGHHKMAKQCEEQLSIIQPISY
jgi:hypothetical protein